MAGLPSDRRGGIRGAANAAGARRPAWLRACGSPQFMATIDEMEGLAVEAGKMKNNGLAAAWSEITHDVIAKAQKGDNEALGAIFEQYKGVVRAKSRLYFLVGADSEDLIQEGMIGLYEAIRDYRTDRDASFRSFAELCVTRQIIAAVASATRQKHIPLNSYVSLSQNVFDDETDKTLMDLLPGTMAMDPEEIMINDESNSGFKNALDNLLSALERDVLRLYLNGDAYSVISEEIGKSEKSIDNTLQRVKRKLEKYIEQRKI
jgi:RNA polymerase sporulation-specific sigma factor